MKKIFIAFFILITSIAYTEEKKYESPMTLYNDTYMIAGNTNAQVKIQLSTKFNLLYPSNTGIYMGYTQLSKWIVYNNRDTFYTMYMPEAFYQYESGNNIFGNSIIPFIDYIQVSPVIHCSTGTEGVDHRSMNTYYGQVQSSYGDVFNIGLNIKAFGYYKEISKRNKDINKYRKNYEADVFFKIRSKTVEYLDKEELHFKFGGNPRGNGWYCIEARFRLVTGYIQPKLFVQFYSGYNEFMIDYNKKTRSIRAGVVF